MKKAIYFLIIILGITSLKAQKSSDLKPRILISTDTVSYTHLTLPTKA